MNAVSKIIVMAVALAATAAPCVAVDEEADPTTAKKAISYLRTHGQRWMDKRGCVSCHQVPAMLWSLGEANNHGLSVTDEEISQWTDWSINPTNFVKPEQKEDVDVPKTLTANIDTLAALMLAITKGPDSNWRQRFADKLCEEQSDNGSWSACGQLPAQKRPKQETNQATTLWVTYALLQNGTNSFDVESAIKFSDQEPVAKSTEWYAVRALVAFAHKADSAEKHRSKLLRLQRDDGGWGWITDQPSDALATGIALYALAQTGEASGPEIQKARTFLSNTQEDSGSWKVPGTKSSAKNKPTATSNYWGTGWAVVGLLATE